MKPGNYNVTKKLEKLACNFTCLFVFLRHDEPQTFSLNWSKENHIRNSFRAVENFTLTLIINNQLNQRNFANFTNFAKFKPIRKIISCRTRNWNLYAKVFPRIFRSCYLWKIIYDLIAKVSFQPLPSELPVMLKAYQFIWASSCLLASGLQRTIFYDIISKFTTKS